MIVDDTELNAHITQLVTELRAFYGKTVPQRTCVLLEERAKAAVVATQLRVPDIGRDLERLDKILRSGRRDGLNRKDARLALEIAEDAAIRWSRVP